MSSHDWSRFILRIPVVADRQAIFNSLTSQKALERWFLRKAEFRKKSGELRAADSGVEVGDSYEWMWHGWPDDVVEKGIILELSKEHLKFSFGKAGNVTVRVVEEKGHNILILLQNEIPTDESSQVNYYLGCSKGWQFFMTNLKSILEGGLDLRNRDVELKDVITA
jgi:uncharacterized protein YndB with AHSA1/START domain